MMASLSDCVAKLVLVVLLVSGQYKWTMSTARITTYGLKDYCQWETFDAMCQPGEIVVVTSARYGRMKLGRCVRNNLGFVGCFSDVLHHVDNMCSGRKTCKITIPNPVFEKPKPCLEDLKLYFEASYKCVEVVSANAGMCKSSSYVKIQTSSGYLASSVTRQTDCGSVDCPWRIEALPGQRINLTLFDFSKRTELPEGRFYANDAQCTLYATIKDRVSDNTQNVCRGTRRVQHQLLTDSHSIEVSVKSSDTSHFLLQFDVIGCPNPTPPLNGRAERKGNQAKVGCRNHDVSWRLRCEGNTWVGYVGNCSAPEAGASQVMLGNVAVPYGVSVAIILAVALVIGAAVFVVGLVCLKRQRTPPTLVQHTAREQVIPYDREEKYFYATDQMYRSGRDSGIGTYGNNDYSSIWEHPLPPIPNDELTGPGQCKFPASSETLGDSHSYCYPEMPPPQLRRDMEVDDPRYFELDPEVTVKDGVQTSASSVGLAGGRRSNTVEGDSLTGSSNGKVSESPENHYTF